MQLVWRPIAPNETDPELLWLVVSVGGLLAAAGWLMLGLPWPICIFHQLTGHPCATCGATRAAVAFFHGHFLLGLRWNPLAFAVYCAIALFDCYAIVVVVTRARRLRLCLGNDKRRFFAVLGGVFVLVNWVYLLANGKMFDR